MHDLLASGLVAGVFSGLLAGQQLRDPLLGTVVDPDGKPVAGAMVEATREAGAGTSILDLDYHNSRTAVARLPTDKHGRFALQLPIGIPCRIRVDQPPFAIWLRDDVQPGEDLKAQLEAPAVFAGRVRLCAADTGVPTTLRAWNAEHCEVLRGRTDAAGNFRFERLPAGKITVDVEPDSAMAPEWQSFELVAGQTTERAFEVAPGVTLRGRITDATTGAPIAGAAVGEGWTLSKKVISDADGRYALRGYGQAGHQEVWIAANGYVRICSPRQDTSKDPTLDLRLEHGNAATGIVVDPTGAAFAGAYVAAIGMDHAGGTHYFNWVSARSDAQGAFRLQGLRADLAQTLLVRADGFASLVYHLPAANGSVHRAGTVKLVPPRLQRGRLVDAGGQPCARVKVGLWGTNADRTALAPEPQGRSGWNLLDMYLGFREVRTDARGQFAFGDLAAGTYRLIVYAENNERREIVEGLQVAADEDPPLVKITASR